LLIHFGRVDEGEFPLLVGLHCALGFFHVDNDAEVSEHLDRAFTAVEGGALALDGHRDAHEEHGLAGRKRSGDFHCTGNNR
jgi:hypothetical protein